MKNSFFLFLILFGIVSSQIDYNINYELRLSIDEDGYESSSFRNFENYFDLNFYFDDLYLYSLLKYNNPPIIGSETKDIDDFESLFEKSINIDTSSVLVSKVEAKGPEKFTMDLGLIENKIEFKRYINSIKED